MRGGRILVFRENQVAQLEGKYFNIVFADGMDMMIRPGNTGHCWYLHSTECIGENACIMFHKHKGSHPYHHHGRARSLRQAVCSI